jgi:hypothetical protein
MTSFFDVISTEAISFFDSIEEIASSVEMAKKVTPTSSQ